MGSVLSRDEIESIYIKSFELLNGVVNPRVKINGICKNLDLDNPSMFYMYNDGDKEVHFNPKVIQYNLYDKTIPQQNAFIVHVVCHELIHAQQCINFRSYGVYEDYTEYIEIEANALAIKFMMDYLQWLSNKLQLELNIDLLINKHQEDLQLILYQRRVQYAHSRYFYGPNGPMYV